MKAMFYEQYTITPTNPPSIPQDQTPKNLPPALPTQAEKYEAELARTAMILQAVHSVGEIKAIGYLEVAKATKEMALRMLELERLIQHIWIHSDMGYAYKKMDGDERDLYSSVVDVELEDLDAKLDDVRGMIP